MQNINPYNCHIPGKQFVGYVDIRQRIRIGLRDGNSYIILGGQHCGKTSLLRQIKEDLGENTDELQPFNPLPISLSMSEFNQLTPAFIFERIYNLIMQQVDSSPWEGAEVGKEYQMFLYYLQKAERIIKAQYNEKWLVVLLIDEMDIALTKLPDDQFFYNLRNLLTESYFHDHFRLVVTGFKDISTLFSPDVTFFTNLHYEYLRTLNEDEAEILIQSGVPDEKDPIDPTTKFLLDQLTGGHPYLLQGILQEIWQQRYRQNLEKISVEAVAKEFLRHHRDFELWLDSFGLTEHIIYQRLLDASDGTCHIQDIRNNVQPSISKKLDSAVMILGCHGIIDVTDFDKPRILGTLFRDWYQSNCPIPHIEEVLKGFEELKSEVEQLPVKRTVKDEVEEILDTGLREIKKPESDEEQSKIEKLIFSLKKVTDIVNAVNETADSIITFVEKAQKIASLLGMAVKGLRFIWPLIFH